MKKRVPTIALLVAPYFYMLIAALGLKAEGGLSADLFPVLIVVYFLFVVAVFIPNMVYAFVLAKRRESSRRLLFWGMLLKLCHIPIYVIYFFLGFIMVMMPLGFILSFLFMIFSYLLLLPSSMYGISGLIQARREHKITTGVMVINGILHFFFCADVISAVVMYLLIREREKQPQPVAPPYAYGAADASWQSWNGGQHPGN